MEFGLAKILRSPTTSSCASIPSTPFVSLASVRSACPDGTPADYYRWRDGIGPLAERPRTCEFFFGGVNDNAFGTDEFLRLCETVGASSSLKINPISLPLAETLDWMQYCNYEENTDLANWRHANGRDAPWDVRH